MKKYDILSVVIIDCVSFSAVVLITALLTLAGTYNSISSLNILQMFLVTTVNAILQVCLLNHWPEKLRSPYIAIQILLISAVIFCSGLFFDWFDCTLLDLAIIFGMVIVIYVLVFGALSLKTHNDANEINRAIQNKKAGKEREEKNG